MKKTYIINEEIKKSSFTVLMLEALGWRLVDSTEVGADGADASEQPPKYVRLAFQRDPEGKSVLFW